MISSSIVSTWGATVSIKQYEIKLLSGKLMNFGLISVFCNATDIFDSYDL
jgi:hypothetical protein